MDKLLTIVIPSYNVASFLPEVMPTYIDERILDKLEILIVNDGSKDDTGVIANEYAMRYADSIKHISKTNGGHGSTINTGIRHATGKYFKVIDGDDWVDTEELVKLVSRLEETDSDIILTPFMRVYESGDGSKKNDIAVQDGSVHKDTFKKEITTFSEIEFDKEYNICDVLQRVNDSYQIHSTTFKTEIIKNIPKISENCFYVDVEYVIFPLEYAKTVIFYDYPVYQYRLGNSNQSVSAKNLVKNCAMHEHVTKRIIEFAGEKGFEGNMKLFMESRMRGLSRVQMDIYLLMPEIKEGKRKWIKFSEYLKSEVPEIFNTLAGKKAAILRKTNNIGFGVMALITRKRLGL